MYLNAIIVIPVFWRESKLAVDKSSVKVGIVGLHFGVYGLLPAFRNDNRCEVIALDLAKNNEIALDFSKRPIYDGKNPHWHKWNESR